MRSYIKPLVRLLDSSIPNLSYYLWLRSRQWVISDDEGNKFMRTLIPTHNWMQEIPDKFSVGDELVDKYDYYTRIDKMNLQYNNMESLVFEVDGSCLFRDILFNINKIGCWAQSNRFLFSILDENARFEEENYHISSEYEGIPEWEDQFDKYMNKIKNDPIVDHNRLEMPYSISSTFWISVNRKTLVDLLSFLKYKAPFFYEIYGKQFIEQIGLEESKLNEKLPASITQYINKSMSTWKEGVTKVDDTYIVNSKMGLILYSQFIRQADTTISGLYNVVMHDDVETFKHEVFKGDTILNIHYVADEDKVLSTVSTRLCAFAMSSGSDPCSWSYFLNNFLPENISPKQLMKLLPCKFNGNALYKCKFHDDIKFRNEGKEISNCPCPLVTLSEKDAINKKERDNNRIGDAYYELTNYLINNGLPYRCAFDKWTSELIIKSDKPIKDVWKIDQILQYIEISYSNFIEDKHPDPINLLSRTELSYGLNGDFTCMLKGLAIKEITKFLKDQGHDSFIISFGGDVFINNSAAIVNIEGTKFNFELNGTYSVFTSGNTNKRGHHIPGGPDHAFSTIIVDWSNQEVDNVAADIACTKIFALEGVDNYLTNRLGSYHVFIFTEDGNLSTSAYCASPFFNDEQVEIRDRMVSRILNAFRPDLTPESIEYNINKNDESVVGVFEANIRGIYESTALVFPNNTPDLGTLYEVGRAIALGHPIIKYNEKLDEYFIVLVKSSKKFKDNENYLFDCSRKMDAIAVGYASVFVPDKYIYYQLNGCNDNIMLSLRYNHVELENGTYVLKQRDPNDRDK